VLADRGLKPKWSFRVSDARRTFRSGGLNTAPSKY
jgi:hypothetical protein